MPRTAKGDGIDVGEADIELALSSELGDRMISAIETAFNTAIASSRPIPWKAKVSWLPSR